MVPLGAGVRKLVDQGDREASALSPAIKGNTFDLADSTQRRSRSRFS